MEDKDKDQAVSSLAKVNKESFDVDINPRQHLLEYSKEELAKVEAVDLKDLNEADKQAVDIAKKNFQNNIERYSKERLVATLVPMKYKDIQTVKNGVLEAMKYTAEFKFDEDIRLKAMIREEHTLTVYLSLRKKGNIDQRYFNSLEEIAKEPETTIEQLYGIYVEQFVLTDEERKNLSGVV